MKKSIKKIIAMGMMAVLISSNAIAVSAQTKSGRVNGINFNAFSNLPYKNIKGMWNGPSEAYILC